MCQGEKKKNDPGNQRGAGQNEPCNHAHHAIPKLGSVILLCLIAFFKLHPIAYSLPILRPPPGAPTFRRCRSCRTAASTLFPAAPAEPPCAAALLTWVGPPPPPAEWLSPSHNCLMSCSERSPALPPPARLACTNRHRHRQRLRGSLQRTSATGVRKIYLHMQQPESLRSHPSANSQTSTNCPPTPPRTIPHLLQQLGQLLLA
jgi:hypothetical protein